MSIQMQIIQIYEQKKFSANSIRSGLKNHSASGANYASGKKKIMDFLFFIYSCGENESNSVVDESC